MSLVALMLLIDVTPDSSSVFITLFPLSSHVLSITSAKFLWYDISSLILFSSMFSLLILILELVSVSFWKVMSALNEL